eukprot:tig00000449_g932.t1
MTFNTRGTSAGRLQQAEDFAQKWALDLMALQELSVSNAEMQAALFTPAAAPGEAPLSSITRGRLIHSIKKSKTKGNGTLSGLAGCEIRLKANRQLFVASVYMPPTESKPEHIADQKALMECLERINADFRSRAKAHLILLGDWNSVAIPAISRIRQGSFVQSQIPERAWWGTLRGTWGLLDAAEEKRKGAEVTFIARHGPPAETSGAAPADDDETGDSAVEAPELVLDDRLLDPAPDDAITSAGRIDAVLHSASLKKALRSVHALPRAVAMPHPSDHFPVMADYDLKTAGLSQPAKDEARPSQPPPLFALHLIDKEKLPAFRKAVEERLQGLETELDKALNGVGGGTDEERRERIGTLYRRATEDVLALAKEHKCLKARGSRPASRRPVAWQLVMDKKVGRLLAGWAAESAGGLPSSRLTTRLEKLEGLVKSLVPGPEPMPRRPVRDPDDAAPFPARYGSWRLYFKLLNNWRNRVRRRHQKETSAERNRQIQEFVTARQARFADPRQLRSYLNSVLERSRGEPIMHVTRLARDGNFYEIYTSPDEVKAVMAEHWKQWCAKRNPQLGGTVDLVPDSALDYLPPDFWRAVYRPLVLQAGAADAFAGTMIEPTYEELGAYVRSLTDGAGGPSNCTNAILKTLWNPELPDAMDPEAYPPRGRRLLMAIVCEVLRLRDLPSEMCESNIFGIPKKGVWDGDIEGNLRPITLQEVGLKLATGLLTKRLADAIEKHGVLQGVNYGFRKAKSTYDALHLTVAILEDAKEHHKPIYILLQDIRRAYDSVSWVSMELSSAGSGPRRGHGLSDAFELECGLPQGGIESPLHWLIFYDALLCAQQELDRVDCDQGGEGVAYVLGDAVADAGQPRARVTGCAYADDTQWWSGTAAGIQRLADVASEFFRMHDITVNASKTEFTYNNVSPEPEAPLLGHPRVPVGKKLAPGAHFKLLGVYLTANLSWTEQIRQMEAQARETVAVIARKQLTAQEACYIVEAVVQARIAYGLKVVPLSEAQCDRLDAIWLRVVKHHGGLAASTSNYALWSHGTYRLPRMAHLMAKNQITDLLARLCGEPDELLSQVMAHRVHALQRKLGVPLLPTEFLNAHVTPQLAKANTIAAVMPLLQRRQYRIQSNHARYVSAPYPPGAGVPWPKPAELLREYVLATHIPKDIFKDAAPTLYAAGMYWMSSVTARDVARVPFGTR